MILEILDNFEMGTYSILSGREKIFYWVAIALCFVLICRFIKERASWSHQEKVEANITKNREDKALSSNVTKMIVYNFDGNRYEKEELETVKFTDKIFRYIFCFMASEDQNNVWIDSRNPDKYSLYSPKKQKIMGLFTIFLIALYPLSVSMGFYPFFD